MCGYSELAEPVADCAPQAIDRLLAESRATIAATQATIANVDRVLDRTATVRPLRLRREADRLCVLLYDRAFPVCGELGRMCGDRRSVRVYRLACRRRDRRAVAVARLLTRVNGR